MKSGMSSLDDGAVHWCSKSGRSKTRRRIDNKNMPRLKRSVRWFNRLLYRPRTQLYTPKMVYFDRRCRKYAFVALSSLNVQSVAKQGPKYEFVDALGCCRFYTRQLYHLNFIVRPINGSVDDNKLCFGEVELQRKEGKGAKITEITCWFTCIIGSIGTRTGRKGCTSCHKDADIQHPLISGFRRKAYEVIP